MSRLSSSIAAGVLATGAAHAQSSSASPTPQERGYLGCYELDVGPWNDIGGGTILFRFQLDSVGSPEGRWVIVAGAAPAKEVRPYTYWTLDGDSLTVRLSSGFELRLRAQRDSVFGVARRDLLMTQAHVAPVRGVRRGCS